MRYRPSPTGGRHIVGHFVVPLIFGALADIVPDTRAGRFRHAQPDQRAGHDARRPRVSSIFFASGGFGALEGLDGAPTTPSPSNMTGTSIEVWEEPDRHVHRVEGAADRTAAAPASSAAASGSASSSSTTAAARSPSPAWRAAPSFAPVGVRGGKPGGLREVRDQRAPVHPKGRYILAPGDRLTTLEAGGGGYGDPEQRNRAAVRADVAQGLVTRESAGRDYKLVDEPAGPGTETHTTEDG